MIANFLNTLLGLWLAYAAIFPDTLGKGHDRVVLIAAIGTVMLALWARRSDASAWQSTTTIVAGVLLAFLEVSMFWGIFWAGLISATLSLWAALYRPSQVAAHAD